MQVTKIPMNFSSQAKMRALGALAVLGLAMTGCGVSEQGTEQQGISDGASDRELLIATVDPDYLSSTLWAFDLSSGEVARGPGGLSGDPKLSYFNEQAWLFNRSATNLNGRVIIGEGIEKTLDREIKFEGAGAGDPAAVVGVADQTAVVAHYNNSRVVVIDTVTGSIVRDLSSDLNLGDSNRVLRVSMLVYEPSRDLIIGIHQARDFEYKFDNSQQFFAWRASTYEAIDLDENSDGIQGRALNIGNPQTFYLNKSTGEVSVAGFCSIFDDASCQSGLDVINLDSLAVTNRWLWTNASRLGNGGVKFNLDGSLLWAQLATGSGADSEKYLVQIDAAAGTSGDLFQYASDGAGCCFLAVDPSSGRLYTGDRSGDLAAELLWFDPGETAPQRIATSGLAYGGVFVP